MNHNTCPKCNQLTYKTVPAGVSRKTGRPYNEFQICDSCGYKPLKRPQNIPDRGVNRNFPPSQHAEVMNALRELYRAIENLNRGIGEIIAKLNKGDEIDPDKINFD